jgi:hypothetical protein
MSFSQGVFFFALSASIQKKQKTKQNKTKQKQNKKSIKTNKQTNKQTNSSHIGTD